MQIITPTWQVPAHINAFSTTRQKSNSPTNFGVSKPPFDRFNLGNHVGDQPMAVAQNRQLLTENYQLPHHPVFLNQTHSTTVIQLPTEQHTPNADAAYTNQANQVCLVMTADCLPVLFTNQQGTEVAAAHAGWRGLCNGILEQTIKHFNSPTHQILAWLAPAISVKAFEVGEEVLQQFLEQDKQAITAFHPLAKTQQPQKYLADLYLLATQRLNQLGITKVYGGNYCTFNQPDLFYSYRREQQTGRMASLIWFSE